MLNTQLAKAFYLCNSLLFISTPFTANPLASVSGSLSKEKKGLETAFVPAWDRRGKFVYASYPFNLVEKEETRVNAPKIKLNRNGIQFVNRYIKNSRESLGTVKKRSRIPFYIIDSVLNLYGLPVELKYLAVIESELKPSALSQVGARGPWQFMPGTAQVLGLKISRHCDERTNYYKSTIAAARYLKDLYAQFNDWLLVLAAYNGGPKPVITAIRKSGSRNFWVLQNFLPLESRDHVKKFIATHYYFEGIGSETTLTRAENAAYKKTVDEFVKSRFESAATAEIKPEKTKPTSMPERPANAVPTANIFYTTIPPETPAEKFARLMKESEECLKKSRKII